MNEMTRCKRIRFPRVTPKGTSLQRRETDIQEVQPKEALMVKRYLSADLVLRSFPILLLFLEVHIVTSQQALTPAVLSLCAWTVILNYTDTALCGFYVLCLYLVDIELIIIDT